MVEILEEMHLVSVDELQSLLPLLPSEALLSHLESVDSVLVLEKVLADGVAAFASGLPEVVLD